MKKFGFFVALGAVVLVMCTACGSLSFFKFGNNAADPEISQGQKPTLGILPFVGGTDQDGNTIANLFAFERMLLETFTVVPRTDALDAILGEDGVSLTNTTDSSEISAIVNLLNADYVLSGSIRKVGNRNLLVVTIINVETFELVAGYYRTYLDIGEVPDFLASMSENLVKSFRQEATTGESLAINPFTGGNRDDALTLTDILAIEFLNTGRYTILPRTNAIDAAMKEQTLQMSGLTDSEGAVRVGQGANGEFVLNSSISSLGDQNMFIAQILNARDSSLISGNQQSYSRIEDGIDLMPKIAILLAEGDTASSQAKIAARQDENRKRRNAEEAETRKRQAQVARAASRQGNLEADLERRAKRASAAEETIRNARRNETEGLSFAYISDGNRSGISFGLLLSGLYWSPVPFANIGIETKVQALSENNLSESKAGDLSWYFGISPTLGVVYPLGRSIRVFANGVIDFGSLPQKGLFMNRQITDGFGLGLTPGFNTGLSFGSSGTFTIKYTGTIYDGHFLNSIGIGIGKMR